MAIDKCFETVYIGKSKGKLKNRKSLDSFKRKKKKCNDKKYTTNYNN